MKKYLLLISSTLLSVGLVACDNNNGTDTNTNKTEKVSTLSEQKTSAYFKNDTLEIDDATIKLTGFEVK
ncbi:hypothetical protein [Bacillus cereus]|uniref:hypothetical protein n=1 Tax=Bacillus cereus TaxID=1396 RepID=UPI000BF6B747|nr:hypothetical protein [Bacillus cereus]PFA66953.1 hypothetical protein CN403_23950 [Bacillus cereus]